MAARFQEPSEWPVFWPALVRCPRCGARAAVELGDGRRARMTCASCALVHTGVFDRLADGSLWLVEGRDGPRWWNVRTNQKRRWPTTREREYALWLRTECCGGRVLWAASEEHLRYLEDYVGAELRERSSELWKSAGLSWRLPTWMKDAKHRGEVVHHLRRLRASLS